MGVFCDIVIELMVMLMLIVKCRLLVRFVMYCDGLLLNGGLGILGGFMFG